MQASTVKTWVYNCLKCVPLPGKGYDKQLKELLDAEILPIVEEFDKKLNKGTNTCSERHTTAQINESFRASELLSKVRN